MICPGKHRSIDPAEPAVDPFSGTEPLHYRRTADSYVLWSIGPDGVDDGGKPVEWSRAGTTSPDARESPLAPILADSEGDFVAGRNR